MGERACKGYTLLLATGQLVRRPIAARRRQTDERQQFVHTIARATLLTGQTEDDVLRDAQVRKERAFLRDVADAPGLGADVDSFSFYLTAADFDRPAACALEPADGPEQCRFAAAGRTEQGEQAAVRDRKIDAAQHGMAAECLVQATYREIAHWSVMAGGRTNRRMSEVGARRDGPPEEGE